MFYSLFREQLVFKLEVLLFGFPLTSNIQQFVNFKFLEERLHTLDAVRGDVQIQLKPLNSKFKTKQVVFTSDNLSALEHRLWTQFYTNISSMIRKTETLNTKN